MMHDDAGDERDDGPRRRVDGENKWVNENLPPPVESTARGSKPEEGPAVVASSSREISPSPPPSSSSSPGGGNDCCCFAIWHYEEPEATGYAVLVMGKLKQI